MSGLLYEPIETIQKRYVLPKRDERTLFATDQQTQLISSKEIITDYDY